MAHSALHWLTLYLTSVQHYTTLECTALPCSTNRVLEDVVSGCIVTPGDDEFNIRCRPGLTYARDIKNVVVQSVHSHVSIIVIYFFV